MCFDDDDDEVARLCSLSSFCFIKILLAPRLTARLSTMMLVVTFIALTRVIAVHVGQFLKAGPKLAKAFEIQVAVVRSLNKKESEIRESETCSSHM